ncbi:MAG: hypothetical protein II896_06845 [Clostridia bacterium]|nr:hypothetical protein [Clostridia bacterium]
MKRIILVLLLSIIIFILCACAETLSPLTESRIEGDIPDSTTNKANISIVLLCRYEKQYVLSEPIYIDLGYGTRVTKEQMELYPLDTPDPNPTPILCTSVESLPDNQAGTTIMVDLKKDSPNVVILCTIKDFTAENYPYIETIDEIVPTKVELPKSLIQGKEGCILAKLNHYGVNAGFAIYYKIKNNTIFFDNLPIKEI